jgi:hypothetical protein
LASGSANWVNKPREDVLLFLHRHPGELLAPSGNDLDVYERTFINPNTRTDVILVFSDGKIGLFLYRKSDKRDYMQFYKSLDPGFSKKSLVNAMNRGGINTYELTLNEHEEKDSWAEKVALAVEALEA